MSSKEFLKPDYVFEVSWEVCNKIGGIYTVLATKAGIMKDMMEDRYIVVGPDVWMETSVNPYFEEDPLLFRSWKAHAESQGLKVRIGRFKTGQDVIAILVDFTTFFAQKDKILAKLWENFSLDSITGQWDYIEPLLFGHAAGKVVESFYEFEITGQEKAVVHCHEWMSGATVLYLKDNVPQIATVFTTHATVLGRSISGNNWPLYRDLEYYNPESTARDLGVMAKFSLEKTAALNADILATVSDVTAAEARKFFGRDVDMTTPNGFDMTLVPDTNLFEEKRASARAILVNVAEKLLGQKIQSDAFFVLTSGRYEFRNKGLDAFVDAIGQLSKNYKSERQIVAWAMVPANSSGPNPLLVERLQHEKLPAALEYEFLTHSLYEPEHDPILRAIRANGIYNSRDGKVKFIFVPAFLDNSDGIFNKTYYDLLIGCDLSVFPSYYEPWGYTPLESLAYNIPSLTTSLSGFGQWIKMKYGVKMPEIRILNRSEDNYEATCTEIADTIVEYAGKPEPELKKIREKAYRLAGDFVWDNMIGYYWQSYASAIEKALARSDVFKPRKIQEHPVVSAPKTEPAWRKVLVDPAVPDRLEGLVRLSKNLWWSWNYDATELFELIDRELWDEVGKNPIALIEALPLDILNNLLDNQAFLLKYDAVCERFAAYMSQAVEKEKEQVAYFSMEYGLHDTVKIYSGGLGMLAGDYIKEASDCNKNLVAVGLLYRYGYFKQEISNHGDQIAHSLPQKFSHMPLLPVRDKDGNWVKISIAFPGRTLYAKAWRLDVGRVPLFLLDTELEENVDADRSVTHHLYGGDWENRLKQELLLGVGGIRLLEALGIRPDVYHLNEGHAAFIGIERLKDLVQKEKLTFNQALEVVRSTSLFTTHTPVPAGHDAFSEDLLRAYIPHYPDRLNITWDDFVGLGRVNIADHNEKFSVSVLAIKLSQEVNGVSRIHGRVSREMFAALYEGYFPDELHISHVTNGVHLPTWTAKSWQKAYAKAFGPEYIYDQSNPEFWKKIYEVKDEDIWVERMRQKEQLIKFMKKRISEDMTRRQENPKLILKTLESLRVESLTIGFARRFATYKRAHLLFSNMERLARIVNNPRYPVQFVFAGKAHPADKAGQDFIKRIYEISKQPEFIGKVHFLENYDMEMAKFLIRGVDVWLNTPTRPLEASGTSGEKAVMNGVVNFSVLDGWWAEGFKPGAGWALPEDQAYANHQFQDELDSETIYTILEDEIIPTYYDTNWSGVSMRWVSHIKNTVAHISPNFTMKRMIDDYYRQFYRNLFVRGQQVKDNGFEAARTLSAWKRRVLRLWKDIQVLELNSPGTTHASLRQGGAFEASILLDTGEIPADEIGIEVLFGRKNNGRVDKLIFKSDMVQQNTGNHLVRFSCNVAITNAGVYDYAFRMYPRHPLLPHRLDFPLVRFL